MEQFTSFDWSDIVGADGDECNRSAATIDEFYLVSFAAFIHVHNGAYVTPSKLLVRRVGIKYDK